MPKSVHRLKRVDRVRGSDSRTAADSKPSIGVGSNERVQSESVATRATDESQTRVGGLVWLRHLLDMEEAGSSNLLQPTFLPLPHQ